MHHFPRYARALTVGVIGLMALWLAGCGALVTASPQPPQATGSTAVVKPYPSPNSTQVVYSNALTAPATGWANGSECMFTSDGLLVRPSGGQGYICLAPTSPLTNASITVMVHQVNGPPTHAFGIAFRHTVPKNYYFFGIDGHGRFTFTIVVNDVSHTVIPFTSNAAIRTGTNSTNSLQVIAKDQVVTFLVNGRSVGQATVSNFPSGTVGLRGINDGEVVFQQLVIAHV